MNIYKFGYYSCEESHYLEFMHKQDYSEQELESILEEVLFEIFLKERNLDSEHPIDKHPSFQILIDSDYFIPALEARGFERMKYKAKLDVFGWAAADTPRDWESYTYEGDLTRKLQESFSKKLKGKANEKQ